MAVDILFNKLKDSTEATRHYKGSKIKDSGSL